MVRTRRSLKPAVAIRIATAGATPYAAPIRAQDAWLIWRDVLAVGTLAKGPRQAFSRVQDLGNVPVPGRNTHRLPSHPRIDRGGEQAAEATFVFHFTHYHHLSGVPVRSGSQRRTVWSLPLRRRSRSTLGSPEQPFKSGIPLRRLARGKGENWPSSFQHFMMMFCLFQLAHCALVEIG